MCTDQENSLLVPTSLKFIGMNEPNSIINKVTCRKKEIPEKCGGILSLRSIEMGFLLILIYSSREKVKAIHGQLQT